MAKSESLLEMKRHRLGIQFFKFALVGITGTVIDFGLFYLLWRGAHLDPILASAISFSLAVVNNFTLNRLWTFADVRHQGFLAQLVQFSIVAIVGLGLNPGIMAFLIEGLGPRLGSLQDLGALGIATWRALEPYLGWWPLFSNAIATIIVLFWNFAGNRLWTFRDR